VAPFLLLFLDYFNRGKILESVIIVDMNIDFENITESSRWFDSHIFAPYYRKLGNIRNPVWLRLGAPLIGVGDGLVSAAQAAAGFGEAVLKGVTNSFRGAANRDSNLLKKGILQIGLGGGSIALFSIPILAVRFLRITTFVAYDPASAISELRQKTACLPPRILLT
jgi:hypothetical protein